MLEERKIFMRQLLFCPGPINTALNVRQATIENEIGHREPEFSNLLSEVNTKLLALFGQKNDKKYYPIVITGSGTAANETVLSSLGKGLSILVLTNGEFGERLYDISKLHNKNTHILNSAWGKEINLDRVERFLKQNPVDVIVMVHHETSSGMLNPIFKVGKLAKKYKKIFVVDTVSSTGSEIIDIEKCNITFCTGSASKAIGSLPGISYVIGKRKAYEALENVAPKIMYLNLYKFYFYSKNFLQTPNTPAVQLFYAFNQALANILNDGLRQRVKKIESTAKKMRAGLKEMNLKFLLKESEMCNFLTTVLLPANLDINKVKVGLKEHNIVIYDGKGPLKGKVFQIGHVGEFSNKEVDYCLKVLRETLRALTLEKPPFKTISKSLLLNHIQYKSL